MTAVTEPLERVPFSVVDEAIHLLDTESEPWSIQLEVRVAGRLDDERMRAALAEALATHPMTRARKVASRRTDHRYHWEITPDPDLGPLRVVDCADDEALDATRAELLSMSVPLAESPPLRARLAHHPRGDLLMLNLNHAATDGFGGLRLLRSTARAYAGTPDPLPDLDPFTTREALHSMAAGDRRTRARRYRTLAEKLRDLATPPARIVADGGSDRPGYGFHHVSLTGGQTAALAGLGHAGTVNDVLLTALHLAIAGWNAEHGAPCGRVTVMVPANFRPREWRDEVPGNFTLMVRFATDAADRTTPSAALRALAAQTRRTKDSGTGAALIEVLSRSPALPMWAKQASEPLLWLSGNRLVDTALLTNLGRIEDPPAFGPDAGATEEMWFSAPGRMPLGLTVGAVTVGGQLRLSFRHRHPLLGTAAVRRFADRYVGALDLVVQAVEAEVAEEVRRGRPRAR